MEKRKFTKKSAEEVVRQFCSENQKQGIDTLYVCSGMLGNTSKVPDYKLRPIFMDVFKRDLKKRFGYIFEETPASMRFISGPIVDLIIKQHFQIGMCHLGNDGYTFMKGQLGNTIQSHYKY